jgi:hypothetical protein
MAALILQLASNPTMLDEDCAIAFSYGQHGIQNPPELDANLISIPSSASSFSAQNL